MFQEFMDSKFIHPACTFGTMRSTRIKKVVQGGRKVDSPENSSLIDNNCSTVETIFLTPVFINANYVSTLDKISLANIAQ
mmetsp:Transcript_7572/g.8800  ORF Transcript_7572/g.8800 Transcript_7572/m.8800 type:complete len:80 (-) Transcript_7572:329-568(-)